MKSLSSEINEFVTILVEVFQLDKHGEVQLWFDLYCRHAIRLNHRVGPIEIDLWIEGSKTRVALSGWSWKAESVAKATENATGQRPRGEKKWQNQQRVQRQSNWPWEWPVTRGYCPSPLVSGCAETRESPPALDGSACGAG